MSNKEFETKVIGALDKLNNRFDGLEGRFDGLEGRFDGLEGRFDGLEGRFDGLEGKFDGLEGKFGGLEGKFGGLEGKFGGLEKDMHSGFNRLEGLINSQTTELKESIDNQGKYMNQAFEIISNIQNERAMEKEGNKTFIV